MTQTHEHNIVLSNGKYDVVGTRPIRHDGADKVTGRAMYGIDFNMPGLLFGKMLRSPHSHAWVKSIDTTKAEALPGVKAVVTAADLSRQDKDAIVDLGLGPLSVRDMQDNVLAFDKVLYQGQAVAGIAATSADIAEQALKLIDVIYETLPSVLTAPEAMEADAPILIEDLHTIGFSDDERQPTNIASKIYHSLGDINEGFASADIIIEREFNTATVHQGYIEPHPATALWNTDGRITLWTSTQAAFYVQESMAVILGIPVSQIKVVPMEIGGGFGGKFPVYAEPVAALLSQKTGQPVKIVLTRSEVFEATGPSSGSYIKVKIGATNEGKIISAQAYLAFEAGAYPGSPVPGAAIAMLWPYEIHNLKVEGLDVVVNKPKTGFYRAPGVANVSFGFETVIDELAEKLEIDPIEIRLINAAKEGSRRPDGLRHGKLGVIEVLEAMRDHPHYQDPVKGPNRGRGVSIGLLYHSGFTSTCTLSVNADGTVNLVEGSTDIGGTRTAVAMQAAEVLGIPAEDIHPTVVDTDSVGYTTGTGGSRVAFATGWAAHNAALEVKQQMIGRAAMIWEAKVDSINMEHGTIRSKHDPELKMSFKELAGMLPGSGGPIVETATVNPSGVAGSAVGNIADVAVDPETGKTEILRYTAIQDAGKAIHPSYVEGQMQGGTAQGIGWALNEGYEYNDAGIMTNSSFLDYRMPVTLDLPMIDTVIVEVPNPGHPYGARGLGEASIITPTGALANAIYHAIGVRLSRLPMNPVQILNAIWGSERDH